MSAYIVSRKDKLFWHFGIMIESGKVLHFASKTNDMFARDQTVKIDSIEEFAIGRKVKIIYKDFGENEDIIKARAKEYWGINAKYSLRNNNCILFVLWCLQEEIKGTLLFVLWHYVKLCFMPTRQMQLIK